jgi:integration host factor subunit beta
MEELVRKMNPEHLPLLEDDTEADVRNNGPVGSTEAPRAETPAGADAAD